ncbi:hypothetical protein BBK14_33845 [Parafrankia soli]|uniref:Uncharacterized protein n=1 Tax=Parafrankia soli TaxID=2599596 RepID=A0A1S1QA35_9ACTN|nr:hypothetical protein [Parafrankia soli]OHV31703.1 hypothetical protein BBK14_33845 [Parafrankia soli]
MPTFEDFVRENTITDQGLRPPWAGNVLAALRHAIAHGSGADRLTQAERATLECLRQRVEGRLGESSAFDRHFNGTHGLISNAIDMARHEPRLAELGNRLDGVLKDYYAEQQAAWGDSDEAGH